MMKFASVKALWIKEAKKALRSTRKEGITNIFASTTIADGSMPANYELYEAAHAVGGIFNESVLVYAYVRGLMNRDMYVKYMPVLLAMENSLYSKKAEKVFSNAIDYINGSKNTNSLIKAAATFYRVAKEG